MRAFIITFLIFIPFACQAQFSSKLNDKAIKGTFYVSVDDNAAIFINGKLFYNAPFNESRSPETELKTGDRIVVPLRNELAGRRFMMVFVGSDGQTIVSFRARDFKIVPDLGVTDFTADEYARWTKSPKTTRGKDMLPVKSYSNWLWGDGDRCILAGTVTHQMFSQRPK